MRFSPVRSTFVGKEKLLEGSEEGFVGDWKIVRSIVE